MNLKYIHSNNSEPHNLAVYEYGVPSDHAIVLLHGFTHNALFYESLAQYLSKKGLYIICPDMPGRGKSEYLSNPRHYNYHQYVDDLFLILNSLKIKTASLFGNSMGGILAILFTEKYPKIIKKIILNDIGIIIPSKESMRIGIHVGRDFHRSKKGDMLKRIDEEFIQSNLTQSELEYIFNIYTFKENELYTFNYDKNLGNAFWSGDRQIKIPELDFTENFSFLAKTCKSLELYVIRGSKSNLLDIRNLEILKSCKQFKDYMEVPHKGHLPLFFNDTEKNIISAWLINQL